MASLNSFVFAFILVWILKVCIAFFLSSLLVLFVALGIHKMHVQDSERRDEDQMASYQAELSLIPGSGGILTPPRTLTDAVNLAHALALARPEASPSAATAMHQAALASKMPEILRSSLKSKNWGTRFRALTGFFDFASPLELPQLLAFEREETNPRVFGNGLMACAACVASTEHFGRLVALMQQGQEISASYYEGVFRTALRSLEASVGRAGTVEAIKEVLLEPDSDPVLKGSLVHAISKEEFPEVVTTALDLARHASEPVITVAVLRALGRSGIYDPIIEENIGNSRQYLNIVALHASGICKKPTPILLRKIENQLRSGDYVARLAAATSLKRLGETGKKALLRASHGSDKYASDISSYILSLG